MDDLPKPGKRRKHVAALRADALRQVDQFGLDTPACSTPKNWTVSRAGLARL